MIKQIQNAKKKTDVKNQIFIRKDSKEKEIPINLKSEEQIMNEDQISKSQTRVVQIQSQFENMGMINPFKNKQMNSHEPFTIQDIIKTIIEIFTDTIESSQPSKFNIINYLVNYVYQKVESKVMTSEFCWSLFEQLGKEAVLNNEVRIILQLIEENSYNQIQFYIKFRKIIFQYLFNLEKNKCGYEAFLLDDYSVICEQWIALNQKIFDTVTYEEMMKYFEDQIKLIKVNYDQDLFYKLKCSDHMKIALTFNKKLSQKYVSYEQQLQNYYQKQSQNGKNRIQKSEKNVKQEQSQFLIKWGWPTLNQKIETIQKYMYYKQNSESFYNENKKSQMNKKSIMPKPRKSIILTQERSKSSNNLKNNQFKQQYPSFNDESISKTPEKRQISNHGRKISITNTAPNYKQSQFTPSNHSQENDRTMFFTPNKSINPFGDMKSSQTQHSYQKSSQFNKTTNQLYYQQ